MIERVRPRRPVTTVRNNVLWLSPMGQATSVPISSIPFEERNIIDHMMISGTYLGNAHLPAYLKKLSSEEGVRLMDDLILGDEVRMPTMDFKAAFAPGWFSTPTVAILPVSLRTSRFAHKNVIICQRLPAGYVSCLHFEPHGHFDKNDAPWIESQAEWALTRLCGDSYGLKYTPVAESCPNVGPQRAQAKLLRNDKYGMAGLCVMHCLNMVKYALKYIKANPNVEVTPAVFSYMSQVISDRIMVDLVSRTHSLMVLGSYRNDQLRPEYRSTKRMTPAEKEDMLRQAGMALTSPMDGYKPASTGWLW